MSNLRFEFKINDTLHVFTIGKSTNAKIAPIGKKVMQSFVFSKSQFEMQKIHVATGIKQGKMKEFFMFADTNCLDCPYSTINGIGGCYTHAYEQYSGFISSLKSIARKFSCDWNNIPNYNLDIANDIIKSLEKTTDNFVRFGSYGEPVLHPFELVSSLANKANNFTGYTHQWNKDGIEKFSAYFMASVHNPIEAIQALSKGFRSFISSVDENDRKGYISCNASKEKDFKTNCSVCGLCNGMSAKTDRSVVINEH